MRMRLALQSFFVVASLLLFLLPDAALARGGIVYGHVYNAETREPIGRAKVTLVGEGTNKFTLSSHDGFYSFKHWRHGDLTITCEAHGMLVTSKDTLFEGFKRPLEVDFYVSPDSAYVPQKETRALVKQADGSYSYYSEAEVKKGGIRGTVVEADTSEPIIGANVIVLGTRLGASTDLEGLFVINNLPEGKHILKISALGFEAIEIKDVEIIADEISNFHEPIKLKRSEMLLEPGCGLRFVPAVAPMDTIPPGVQPE